MRYGPKHNPHNEWVYNPADIDGSSIVWAREMDSIRNLRLLKYFSDRHYWLLNIKDDNSKPEIVEYRLD